MAGAVGRRRIARVKRSVNVFWQSFRRSRKGIAGVMVIILFFFMAGSASFLTPHDPLYDWFVGGQRAAPEWFARVSNLPYSLNVFPVGDPGFSSKDSLKEWRFESFPEGGGHVGWTYSNVHPPSERSEAKGSILITYAPPAPPDQKPVTVIISKEVDFQYTQPFRRFLMTLSILPTVPANMRVQASYQLTDPDQRRYELWAATLTPGLWNLPLDREGREYPLDSLGAQLKRKLGPIWGDPSGLLTDPADLIFRKPGKYQFVLSLTFIPGGEARNAEVFVSDLSIKLYGSAFGLLGTDHLGRDLFTQLLYGARGSLYVGVMVALFVVGIGLVMGVAAGYLGGVFDEINSRFTDFVLVLPALPLLIVVLTRLGASLDNLVLVLGLLLWTSFAKIIRSQTLSLRERAFVEAARATGAGPMHIIAKHIIPNVVSLTYVYIAISVPGAIVTEAVLSFIGLSDPNSLSWGRILQEAFVNQALTEWWWILPPGTAIALLSMAFVLMGYSLDEILNPKFRKR